MTSSPRRLSDLARYLILPQGIVTTGWPKVRKAAKACGITYDPWQDGLGTCILGKRASGEYAANIGGVVISIARQVGKTFTIGTMIFMLCILTPGLKVLWTAHHSRTSDETFKSLQGLASSRGISKYVKTIRQANGQQEIMFTNGARILFGAREHGWGRGFAGVDIEIFDEAQILTEKALDNMVPTMNTAKNPLMIMMGTPPKPSDPSEAFSEKRRQALAGDTDMLYVEFSADKDADPEDRTQWEKANPSYPGRTSESAILRMKRTLSEDSFRREGLGIWDEMTTKTAINPQLWESGTVDEKSEGGRIAYGLDMPPDRSSLVIGACARYEDGSAHIEMADIKDVKQYGVAWAADWIKQRWPKTVAVVIDAQSPATVLLPELKARHVKVMVTDSKAMGQACGRFTDMLHAETLHHLPDGLQPQLAAAIKGATTRNIGTSGAFGWNKIGSDIDISPLVACTLALHGAFTSVRRPGQQQKVMI